MAVYCRGMKALFEPIGMGLIAGYLRKNGQDVLLMEATEEELDLVKIQEYQPDVIALPLFDVSKDAVYRVVDQLRSILEETYICIGGVYGTYFSQEILKENSSINGVIRGEGEQTTLQLIEILAQGRDLSQVDGLTWRQDDQIVMNPDQKFIGHLDEIPWAARDLLKKNKRRIALVSTSRGCIGHCNFCITKQFWKKWRGRSTEDVVNEIEDIVQSYNVRMFNFVDNSFEDPDAKCQRLRRITQGIVDQKLHISYFADFRSEFHNKADHDLMELLVKSGLCGACVGIESGNDFDMKLYGKLGTVADNIKTTELFQKYDVRIILGFINFNPYSTFEGLHKNMDYLEKYGFAAEVCHLIRRYMMYENSELYYKLKEDQLLKPDDPGEYGYNYVDSRVETLVNYLVQYDASRDEQTAESLAKIECYSNEYSLFMSHLKRMYTLIDSEKTDQIFKAYKENFRVIHAEFNHSVAEWYRRLLNLAEDHWDEQKAEQITAQLLSDEYIQQTASRFMKIINQTYFKLMRIDTRYVDDLEYFSQPYHL